MQSVPIIFRCDASSDNGWGRFRRSYAIAETAQQSGRFRVTFLSRELPKNLQKKVSEIHANLQSLPIECSEDEECRAVESLFDLLSRKRIVLVVDHASWSSEAFRRIKQDPRVLLIAFDDGEKRHYEADFVINPNLDAESIAFSTSEDCTTLVGPKYAMIRDEIHTLRQHPTERMAEGFQFLVSLGVGDKWGYGLQAIEATKKASKKFDTHLVVPPQWPHVDTAKKMIGNHPRVHLYEDPSFFPQLLARADLALCSAGIATYELAYLGVPMMTVALNSKQVLIGKSWSNRSLAEFLGSAESLSSEGLLERVSYWMEREQELEERGSAAQKLVDGRGKFRLLERVSKILNLQ